MQTLDERLTDLLVEWDFERDQGNELTPEQLCPDNTELREALRARLAEHGRFLAAIEPPLDAGGGLAPPSSALPTIPGYEAFEVLGHGGMGVVYRARHLRLKRTVALKMILGGPHVRPEQRDRLRTEAEAIARLQHPNIVQIFEVGEHEGRPYLALEHLSGGNLAKSLAGMPQPPADAARLVAVLARAIQAAHAEGVIHRDLKPSNVLLAADGTPKVADFGLAKQLDSDSGQTFTGQVMGTPSYMAPEQADGRVHDVGPATDVYALGAILYELLTGRPPFKGASVSETLEQVRTTEPVPPGRLQPKTPRDLETICLKCLEKDQAQRYQSAESLADDLGRFLEGRPILARRIGPHEVAWRWCKRRPALAAALAMLALVTVTGFCGITWQWSVARAERNRAEANLGRVVDGLDRWYAQFTSREGIRQEEFAPLRREFLQDALGEFERLAAEYGSNPRFRKEHILATGRASQVYWELGNTERSVSLIRASIEEAQRFLAENPASFERQEALYRAIHRGIIQETDPERINLVLAPTAEKLFQQLLRAAPPERRAYFRERNILNAYNMALKKLETGDDDEARELFLRSIELAEALLGEGEDILIVRKGLGTSYSRFGLMEAGRGKPGDAEKALRRSNGLFKDLLVKQPQSLEALLDYCVSCEQLENFFSTLGRMSEATGFAEEVCRVLEEAGSQQRPGYVILAIRQRLVRGYYMIMLQHRDNYLKIEKTEPAQATRELSAMNAACRKTYSLADALGQILTTDGDLDYWNAASRLNLHINLVMRDKKSVEAGALVDRACELLETSLKKKPDEQRQGEREAFQEVYDEFHATE